MATVNSRIPQGKPSRIPGGGGSNPSRLVNISTRSKPASSSLLKPPKANDIINKTNNNNKPSSNVTESYRLTFIKPVSETVPDLVVNKQNCSNDEEVALNKFTSQACEELDPDEQIISPRNRTEDDFSDKYLNTVNRSTTSSPLNIDAKPSLRKPSRSSHANKIQSQAKVRLTQPSHKPTNPVASRSESALKARDPSLIRESRSQMGLPPSCSLLTAANAIDYVKKLTSQDDLNPKLSNTADDVFNRKESLANSTTRCQPSERTDPKSTDHSDRTANSKPKHFSSTIEITPTSRPDKRVQSSLAKSKLPGKSTKNVADVVHAFESKQVQSLKSNFYRNKLLGSEPRKVGAGLPRIVRPVMRPPRQRARQNKKESLVNCTTQNGPDDYGATAYDDAHSDRTTSSDVNDLRLRDDVNSFSKRPSAPPRVPSTNDPINPHEDPGPPLVDDEHPALLTCDIFHPQKYKLDDGIRIPEEKLKVFGGQSARPPESGQEPHVPNSPTHKSSLSCEVNLDSERESKQPDQSTIIHNTDHQPHEDHPSPPPAPSSTSVSKHDDSTSNTDRPISRPGRSHPGGAPCTEIPDLSNVGQPTSFETWASSDGAMKLTEATVTAPSNGYLKSALDELVREHRTVLVSLEEIYHLLSEEEKQKARLEGEVEHLRGRNGLLTDEVNRLTRIMEFQLSPATKRRNASETLSKRPTREVSTQTECGRSWFKSSFSDMKQSLVAASDDMNKVMDYKQHLDTLLQRVGEGLNTCIEATEE